jgi:NTP pyrophosphatase (non-canonical NTP hydrolase)
MSDAHEEALKGIRAFVENRNWEQYHDPKNLAMALGSEVGELLDLFRWVHSDEADELVEDPEGRRRIEEEVGDVAICLLMLCDRLDIDLYEAVESKLEANRRKYPADEYRVESD